MKSAILVLFALLAVPALQAQEKPAPAPAPRAAAETKVFRVTVLLRAKGNNIPGKFVSYLDEEAGHVVLPLFHKDLPRWIAEVDREQVAAGKQGRFILRISDVGHLEFRSSESTPLAARPLEILDVNLPLEIGPEIPVFKSPTLSIAIQFEEGS